MQHQNLVASLLPGGKRRQFERFGIFLFVPAVAGTHRPIGGKRRPARSRRRQLRGVVARDGNDDRVLQPVDDSIDIAQLLHPQILAVEKIPTAQNKVDLVVVSKIDQTAEGIQQLLTAAAFILLPVAGSEKGLDQMKVTDVQEPHLHPPYKQNEQRFSLFSVIDYNTAPAVNQM